ncbi:hypothetical protein CRM22_007178 [Opisthorchis felineus]|uniref:Trematode PH-like domain-containing protein n=1 Tax=Opisthorchis felineus TaxID=147828 RepID=A0A4S2LH68_OPIFE|nr:hypothetical protein CRM22_007178 [Opisthorchis felineus]
MESKRSTVELKSSGEERFRARVGSLPEAIRSNNLVDKKTKQNIEYQCFIIQKKQYRITKQSELTDDRINELLDKYYTTKPHLCQLFCLEDHMRFSRLLAFDNTTFRLTLKYSSIKCWTLSSRYVDAICLLVKEPKSDKQTFEIYQCTSQQDAENISYLLSRVKQEPNCMFGKLRSPFSAPSALKTFFGPDSSLSEMRMHMVDDAQQTDLQLEQPKYGPFKARHSYEARYCASDFEAMQSTSTEPLMVRRRRTLPYLENVQSPMAQYGFSSVAKTSTLENNWTDNVTFLQCDPKRGPRLSATGPIYMFAVRIKEDPCKRTSLTLT